MSKELFLEQLVNNYPRVIAIDTETISLKEKVPIGFCIAVAPDEAWWFNCLPERDVEIELLKKIMTDTTVKKVFANALFDLAVLPLALDSIPFDTTNIVDILVEARLLGRTKASLTELANEVGHATLDAGNLIKEFKGKTMLDIPLDIIAKKCADDARATLALEHYLSPQLASLTLSLDYIEVEMKVLPLLLDIGMRGLAVDQEARAAMEALMESDRDYYKNICVAEGFNPGSGLQSGYILAKRGNFLPFTKGKKQLKTDEDTLEFLDDPLASAILGFKRSNSILTKYLYPLRGRDRIYSSYGVDTEVGRTKSSNFNMQNIPAKSSRVGIDVRHIFIPDSGTFTTGDFSQLHLRFLAYMSDDREMKLVYEEGKDGGDIHASTMKKIHKPRAIAKIVNYIIPYGGDARVLAMSIKTKDLRWCSSLLDDWFRAYPDAAAWLREAKRYAIEHGKALPTLFGRQIAVPEERNAWEKINYAAMERKGANYPILGSDGEVMKRALIICCEKYQLPVTVQVHDSITANGDVTFPVEELEHIVPSLLTPFTVEKTTRWT